MLINSFIYELALIPLNGLLRRCDAVLRCRGSLSWPCKSQVHQYAYTLGGNEGAKWGGLFEI